MEPGKSLAARVLCNLGFQVEEIPVADSRTADLRATDNKSLYYVEVKAKLEAAATVQERNSVLDTNGIYEQNDLLAHDNRISGILRDARNQLDETPKEMDAFQLIWFHADGIDADLKYRQAFATFYGQVYVNGVYPYSAEPKGCFYFDYSAAFSMPSVEALILTDSSALQLCLNEFAIRAEEFRSSRLYREFRERGGVLDPVELEATGKIISCRATIPRKNDIDTAKALQQQTGILYTPLRLVRYTASSVIPPGNAGAGQQAAQDNGRRGAR